MFRMDADWRVTYAVEGAVHTEGEWSKPGTSSGLARTSYAFYVMYLFSAYCLAGWGRRAHPKTNSIICVP